MGTGIPRAAFIDSALVQPELIGFFQALLGQGVIGEEVTEGILQFYSTSKLLKAVNYHSDTEQQFASYYGVCDNSAVFITSEWWFNPRTDEISIKLWFNTFKHFLEVSGLHANMEKSSLYIAGVTDQFKEQMLQELSLTLGELPFKYLGVPLLTRKLSIQQCLPMVEKMIARINCWSSKLLSYSGRLQLVKSIPFEMQTYWAQIFLLAKKIISMVNTVCKTFLWTGSNNCSRKALVAWETICKPKTTGGLNVLDLLTWNR
ncbi:uncharacterized protein LOC132045475 [Lycium ferocissimum]|uniref:uncharacterized protein LOC132045475 n=1 Tax=Lycium ferocissimum TaxID=112874 RepID=UPI002814E4D8|nr:uncharacterized protein LOC132045475 [Lycium ferocissimum]